MSQLRRARRLASTQRAASDRKRTLQAQQLEPRQVFSAVPLTFTQVDPSWMVLEAQVSGQLAPASQVKYTAQISQGQVFGLSANSTNAPMGVKLLDPTGKVVQDFTTTGSRVEYLTPTIASVAGAWSIIVSAPSGPNVNYSLDVVLNGGTEGRDSTLTNVRNITATLTTLPNGTQRYAALGTSQLRNGVDVDTFHVTLKNKVGKSIAIQLTGLDGQALGTQKLEVIDPNGVVRAIASPDPDDPTLLQVPNFIVPADGRYTFRITSTLAGDYSLVIVDGTIPRAISTDAILQQLVDLRLVTPTTVDALLNTLTFDNVYQSMNAEQLVAALRNNQLLDKIGDASTLRAMLETTRDIDLNSLRPDGILTALATADWGPYLRRDGAALDAAQAKALLKAAFEADRAAFLRVFSIGALIDLFDDSIPSANGVTPDPIVVIADKTVAPGYENVIAGYKAWVSDPWRLSGFPLPENAVPVVNAMPEGYRSLVIFSDFLEVNGYGSSVGSVGGYVDPNNSTGKKSVHYLLWMDDWQEIVSKRMEDYFTEYKRLGGQLDYLILDMEDTMFSYHAMVVRDRRVDQSKVAQVTVWEELLADPRWPELKQQLIARGIPESELELNRISRWRTDSANAARWNAVMSERRTEYLNAAITDTVLKLFPNAIISNYSDANQTQTMVGTRHSLFMESNFSLGAPVGNAQARTLYGHRVILSTPDGFSEPDNQITGKIQAISYQQNSDSKGNPVGGGTVTVKFFSPVNGVQVGNPITVLNRGGQWIDPRYTGTFTITSISADRMSLTYSITSASTAPIPSADLTNFANSFNAAYVDFQRSYEPFVAVVKSLRSQVATSSTTLLPWISNPGWIEDKYGIRYDHYGEGVFHAVLSGAQSLLWWKVGFDPQPENTAHINALMQEVNALVGYSDRRTLSFNDAGWNDGYVMTGMEANGQRVYRFTPDPLKPMTILSSTGTVRIQIGDQIVEVPNASIYTPASTQSSLGLWIVQTKGTTALNGSPEQVLQKLTQSLAPSFSAPTIGVVGTKSQITVTPNPNLVPPGTQLAFEFDWTNDGKIDHTTYASGQITVSLTYPSAKDRVIRVNTTIVGTGERLPAIEIPLRVLPAGFSLQTSTSDASVKNLIYAGTPGNDYVIFESAAPGVIEAFVLANGTSTKHVFTGVTGSLYAYGLGGNDTLIARGVNIPVALYGGDGNDILVGGSGINYLNGENGNDLLVGGTSSNLLDGGDGLDTVNLGGGANWVAPETGTVTGSRSYSTVNPGLMPSLFQVFASARIAAARNPSTGESRVAAAALPQAPLAVQPASAVSAAALDQLFDDEEDHRPIF